MFDLVDVNLEKEMDNALHYVSENLIKTGHNTKPVLLHSFKVAMTLYSNNYSKDIVIAAILHDLIEDTNVTADDIEIRYGKKIRNIVESVSFDPNIDDKLKQAKVMYDKCIKCGKDALIVKCADLLDNINFVSLSNNKEELLKKYKMFLEMSKDYIGNEIIYKLLKEKYDKIVI